MSGKDKARRRRRESIAAAPRIDRNAYWRRWPVIRLTLAEFNALPIDRPPPGQPQTGRCYRIIDERCGRICVVEPIDDGLIGLKKRPIIRMPALMRELADV
jgi:hypothetical protein